MSVVRTYRHIALAVAVLIPLSLAFSPGADAQSALPGIGAVNYDERGGVLTLSVPYGARNPYRVLWLNGPNRLVVDIEGLLINGKRNLFIGSGVVERIRAARFNKTTTRVVFDLSSPADLRTVTDGSGQRLLISVYPRGGAPAVAPVAPQVRPTPVPTPPEVRITPVPLFTPPPVVEPTPAPVETPVFATPEPTPIPMPTTDAYDPFEPIEPTEPEAPVVVEEEAMVFGSRLTFGADVPLALTESYPAGGSDSTVSSPLLGGTFAWNQMFTPNVGMSLGMRAIGYTLRDAAVTETGSDLTHKRDDIEGDVGIRFRLPLGGGLEMMAEPGFMLRAMMVQNKLDGADTIVDEYLYSPWLGYGPKVGAGLGWRVFGPLSLVATGEFNYFMAGTMFLPSVDPVFPMIGIRAGGEARMDFGFLGLAAGYNFTNYSFSGAAAGGTLSQTWSGPYVRTSIVY